MAFSCCKNKFRTQEAFQEHRAIHDKGLHTFTCPKCNFKSPTLGEMVRHKIIHNREMIAVLKKENRFCHKPWFIPKEENKDIGKNLDNVQERNDIQQNREIDNLDSDSNRDDYVTNSASSHSELNDINIDDPKIIFNDSDFVIKVDTENDNSEIMDPNITCSICDTIFQEKALFEKHIQMHSLPSNMQNSNSRSIKFIFNCEKCDFKSENIVEFDIHKKTHYKSEAFVCKKCGRNFQTKSQLLRHSHKMHSKPYVCKSCQFQTKYHHSLVRHVKGIHSMNIDMYSTDIYQSNSNDCDFDDVIHSKQNHTAKPFKGKSKNKHTIINSVKTFNCLTCGKIFANKIRLQDHMIVHSNVKPFHCLHCDYKSKWNKNLKAHMKTHKINPKLRKKDENVDLATCDYINEHMKKHRLGESDKNENKLRREEKNNGITNNKESEHQTNSSPLKIHIGDNYPMNSNTANRVDIKTEKFFNCNMCEYKSKWSGNLRKHILKTHKDENSKIKEGRNFEKSVGAKEKVGNNDDGMVEREKSINNAKCKMLTPNQKKKQCTPKTITKMTPKLKKQFGCHYCEYTSKWSRVDVIRHMKSKHGKVGSVIINNGVKNTEVSKISSKIHVDNSLEYYNQFGCSYCSYISKRSSNDVHEHMKNIHSKTGDIIIRKRINKGFKTSKIAIPYNDGKKEKNNAGKPRVFHKKVYKCSFCDYTSYKKKYFDKHLTSHSQGSGPVVFYKCPECLQCFILKRNLISHLAIHVGKPLKTTASICPGCNKSFNSDRNNTFSHIRKCLS